MLSTACFVIQKLLPTEARHDDRALTKFDSSYVVVLTFLVYKEALPSHVTVLECEVLIVSNELLVL